jgi:hypothetical protein
MIASNSLSGTRSRVALRGTGLKEPRGKRVRSNTVEFISTKSFKTANLAYFLHWVTLPSEHLPGKPGKIAA